MLLNQQNMDLEQKIERLFCTQTETWELLQNSISQLNRVKSRDFYWNDISVRLQYNPARLVSTASKVDQVSIATRACFLCAENRPEVQHGIPFLKKYSILCNPYPILKQHLTIPLHSHVPQRIRKKIGDMLHLAELLPSYIIFYNGPKSGASAPDHFHFQAGLKAPILLSGDNALRVCLTIDSASREEVVTHFNDVYHYLSKRQPEENEPMINLIAFVADNRYVVHLFPRKAHRPHQYFQEGKQQLLISPGALDMAGLIITPREEDFLKITKDDIEDIYSQVSLAIV